MSRWRSKDQTRLSRYNSITLPLEIKQLERAFIRATQHITNREKDLLKAAQRQEQLIQEVHHRVKNNLQIIASLLNLHANQMTSPEAREDFRRVRDRVNALSSLHHHLYDNPDLSAIKAQSFIPTICQNIIASHGMNASAFVKTKFDIDELLIPQSQSVPLTLIIIEIISNSLRYAFPDERYGVISVILKRAASTDSSRILLTVSDDGIGIAGTPPTQKPQNYATGIGKHLIHGFAKQLNADLIIQHDQGTCYQLSFALDPVEPTSSTLA